jgi:hypothetical protein
MGVGGQRHGTAALPPGMTRYLLYRRLGGPQVRSGRVLKISPPPHRGLHAGPVLSLRVQFKMAVSARFLIQYVLSTCVVLRSKA